MYNNPIQGFTHSPSKTRSRNCHFQMPPHLKLETNFLILQYLKPQKLNFHGVKVKRTQV